MAKADWVLHLISSFVKLPEVSTQDVNHFTLVDVNHYDISKITFMLFIVISAEVLIHLSFPTGIDAAPGHKKKKKTQTFFSFFTLPFFHVATLLHYRERVLEKEIFLFWIRHLKVNH